MAIAVARFRERLTPYFSLKYAGMVFGGLTAVSLSVIVALALLADKQDSDISVTVPLGSTEATVEDLGEPVSVGRLHEEDHATSPDQSARHRPPIEDAIAGLHETTPLGMVPIVRKSDGLTAFKAYQGDFSPAPDSKAMISLVMVDYGLSKKISDIALDDLPEGITFALSAYSQDAQTWTTSARQRGHEVWMSLPMQSQTYGGDDSGNQTLLVSAGLAQNKNRLLTTLGKATGYVGVIDMDTPAFSASSADLDRLYSMILERGLGLAQANPKDTLTGEFAITHKAPFIQNDIWIDEKATPEAVTAQLDKLKSLASEGQIAVGFFNPYPSVIEAIAKWKETLARDKIELAPLSAAIDRN